MWADCINIHLELMKDTVWRIRSADGEVARTSVFFTSTPVLSSDHGTIHF